MTPLVTHLISFLIGSIPIGYLIARIHGIDVRKTGSGNTGATNVARAVGKKSGIQTLLGDIAKGVIGCWAIPHLLGGVESEALVASHGFAAILGHCYSPFLSFRGGKGVATSLGVFIVLSPLATVAAVAGFAVVFITSRYVSLASIVAALIHPLALWALSAGIPEPVSLLVSVLTCLLVVSRHEQNIRRLSAGTEMKFSSKVKPRS